MKIDTLKNIYMKLSEEEQLYLLARLLYNITVTARMFCNDNKDNIVILVQQFALFNEISHIISGQISSYLIKSCQYPPDDFYAIIKEYLSKDIISSYADDIINRSIQDLNKQNFKVTIPPAKLEV